MKSHIDWNEIVPRLADGLKQTLYLEAVRLIGARTARTSDSLKHINSAGKTSFYNAEHARSYYRDVVRPRRAARAGKPIGTRRKFSDEQRKEILAFAKEHGSTLAVRKFEVTSSILSRWKKAETPT